MPAGTDQALCLLRRQLAISAYCFGLDPSRWKYSAHTSGVDLCGPSVASTLAPASTSFCTAASEPEQTALCSAVALGLSPTFSALGFAPSARAASIASSLPL